MQESREHLQTVLRERFGLAEFRLGQEDILQSVLENRDALAVMPTGRGKSLCYQLPAVAREGTVIVVSPLIALMKDQVSNLRRMGIPAGSLHSGQDDDEKRAIFAAIGREKHYILFLSPERVQKPGFAAWVKRQNISLFAIDEAHCVSQWGSDFRQDYNRLSLLRELKPEVPILALTATATPAVLNDISRQLQLREPDRHVHGFYRANLYCQVEACENDAVKMTMLTEAITRTPEGRILIYCGTRKQCEQVSSELSAKFAGVGHYHAGLGSEDRTRTQTQYETGELRILAATNAFGMGIDHPNVRLVVHYQMPANVESYYQEMGRAGRDGRPSTCLLLYAKKDRMLHSFFIRQAEEADTEKVQTTYLKQRWRALDAITQFSEGGECRHAGILTYFRDSQRIKNCGHCDICAPAAAGHITVPVAKVAEAARTVRKRAAKREPVVAPETLSREALLRVEILKDWRKTYADSLDLPAFLVFSNKTLYDLGQKNPRSVEELKGVYGLGPQKIETFGSKVIEQLKLTQG
jgi:ATP-dependent DNA helicase RecQ